jgi:hypothetical protein
MARESKDQFLPKWRHFHPLSTLYLSNPFDEDIIFQVADERNQPIKYVLKARKVNELPGGPIATLGLKAVIDKMIGDRKEDALRIWEPAVREKYEAEVIVKVKEAPQREDQAVPGGPIDLSTPGEDDDNPGTAAKVESEPEEAFPEAKKDQKGKQKAAPLVAAGKHGLGSEDQVIEED